MVHNLFDAGWPENANMERVYNSNFESAAHFLSRENANS